MQEVVVPAREVPLEAQVGVCVFCLLFPARGAWDVSFHFLISSGCDITALCLH